MDGQTNLHLQTGKQRLRVIRKPPRLEFELQTLAVIRPVYNNMNLGVKRVTLRIEMGCDAADKVDTVALLVGGGGKKM